MENLSLRACGELMVNRICRFRIRIFKEMVRVQRLTSVSKLMVNEARAVLVKARLSIELQGQIVDLLKAKHNGRSVH